MSSRRTIKVVVVGAGSVGRSIARELLGNGHQVMLIDREARAMKYESVPDADWFLADACEIAALEETNLAEADALVAATGDDKANLVTSLLAKTEFGVPRTVARVNNPKNEWMFDEAWGVDVSVSTPRLMTALVEEAVSVGDLVRMFTFQQGKAALVEFTLPSDSPIGGTRVGDISFPASTVLVAIIRDERPIPPSADDTLEPGDELLFITSSEDDAALTDLLRLSEEDDETDASGEDGSSTPSGSDNSDVNGQQQDREQERDPSGEGE